MEINQITQQNKKDFANKKILHIKNTFSNHGDEIEEIISNRAPFIVRYGIVIFSIFLLILFSLTWFIKYSDVVNAKARLSAINAPKKVSAKKDGKLITISVQDSQMVVSGQVLGILESVANPFSVINLNSQLDSIMHLINNSKSDQIGEMFSANGYNEEYDNNLGELQSSFQIFIQAFLVYKDFLSHGFYSRKKIMLANDLLNIKESRKYLLEQKALILQDFSLIRDNFKANESLVSDKVISVFDYRNEKSRLIAKQLTIPQINSTILLNEAQQNEKYKEIVDLENQRFKQKNIFIQSVQTMKSQILDWEMKYLLKAPVSGSVSLVDFFQENQEVRTGQSIFSVQPNSTIYFVEMLIPQYNLGKVKAGQSVLLKFFAYPEEQYGSVLGKIEKINANPSDSGFLAKVILPNGLVTNQNKVLEFRNGLTARADIITKDMRLLNRIYYNVSKQFKR